MVDQPKDMELLSGYIDGMLDDRTEHALESRLEREPGLARRLEAMRQAETEVRSAYTAIADEPVPPHLVALLKGDSKDAARPDAHVVPLRRRARPAAAWPALAAAASIALAVGVMLGLTLVEDAPGNSMLAAGGSVVRGQPLFEVLETVESQQSRSIGPDLIAQPQFTFRSENGGLCRQIELRGATQSSRSVACRQDDRWQILATVFSPGSMSGGDGNLYRPASGESDAIVVVVDNLIVGPPLGVDAEREAIRNDWATSITGE
jgi:hypothetical protein